MSDKTTISIAGEDQHNYYVVRSDRPTLVFSTRKCVMTAADDPLTHREEALAAAINTVQSQQREIDRLREKISRLHSVIESAQRGVSE